MKIQYYRIFVEKTKQLSLFDDKTTSKKELIYSAFNVRQPLYINIRGQRLAFVTRIDTGPYIFGTLAKAAHVNVQKSPEENFVTESIESWPHVPIIINTGSDGQSGQSVIVGWNRSIFKNPLYQLRMLAKELTRISLIDKGYELVVNTITDKEDFWKHVTENAGFISSLSFYFEAPNLFKTDDSLNDELRDAKEAFGITHTQVKLENSSGELSIPRENKFINESLKYVSDGGGSYKIKLKNKSVISSREFTKISSMEESELELSSNDRSTLESFCDKLFLWLKHSE